MHLGTKGDPSCVWGCRTWGPMPSQARPGVRGRLGSQPCGVDTDRPCSGSPARGPAWGPACQVAAEGTSRVTASPTHRFGGCGQLQNRVFCASLLSTKRLVLTSTNSVRALQAAAWLKGPSVTSSLLASGIRVGARCSSASCVISFKTYTEK